MFSIFYRDVIVAVFNLSGKMSHSNDAFCLSACVSFINYIFSHTTKFGTFTTTYRKFSFKVVVIISTFSNKGVKSKIIASQHIFKFNCAFCMCVIYCNIFHLFYWLPSLFQVFFIFILIYHLSHRFFFNY